MNIDQVIRVRCLLFKRERTRGDYHDRVRQDKADVFPHGEFTLPTMHRGII